MLVELGNKNGLDVYLQKTAVETSTVLRGRDKMDMITKKEGTALEIFNF